MPSFLRALRLSATLIFAAAALAACSDAPTTAPSVAPSTQRAFDPNTALSLNVAASGNTLLACSSSTSQSASAYIDKKGGIIQVAGSALIVPPNAVPKRTRFTVTIPKSPYVEIDVSAQGFEHYEFRRPVGITLSYARCADSALPRSSLDAWWIDLKTRDQLGGVIFGVDDRTHKRLTFITDHLSGYAVVYRSGSDEDEVGFGR